MKEKSTWLLETTDFIKTKINMQPKIALVLGSGWGDFANAIQNPITLPYASIPHFPVSTVEGHSGQLVCGSLLGKQVLVMQGRFHYYEGYDMSELAFPIRVLAFLGVKYLIVTNAAGAINESFQPGDLMLIKDHINFLGANPLRGPNENSLGPRFPDMTNAYDPDLNKIARDVAIKQGIDLAEGVYAAMSGPSFETPAEIRFLRKIGADAVGMSTVPEVIVANHSGVKVLGISLMSNMAAGILPEPLSHVDVMAAADAIKDKIISLVSGIVAAIEV